MKKSFLTFLVAAFAACSMFFSCASAPKEKRSLKWDAEKIVDIKKAKILAENYDMNVIEDSQNIFIAKNDLDEKVVFYKIVGDKIDDIFSYVEISSNATSLYQQQRAEIRFYMKNTDKEMKYDGPGYYIKSSDVKAITLMCCRCREGMRGMIRRLYGIDLQELLAVKASDFN